MSLPTYNKSKRRVNYEALPKDAYVVKILGAKIDTWPSGGQYLNIAFDIAEGEYKDFFANEYRAQDREDKKWHGNYYLSIPTDDGSEKDGWTKRKFKTFTNAVEDSNAGYTWNWDENTLKGKLFGALYREKEFEGTSGDVITTTECGGSTDIASIRSGDFRLPKDKLLERPATVNNAYAAVPDNDLPF